MGHIAEAQKRCGRQAAMIHSKHGRTRWLTPTVRPPLFMYNAAMKREGFEKLVAEGYERLPQWVQQKINNVALLVEDEPSQEDRQLQVLSDDETLLGLYKGTPLSERGELYGIGMTLPDTITLYQFPIEDAAQEDNLPVAQVVAETIWHEFAHHFGMDEHAVRDREQKRDSNH
jgi:predicted Zn-dependent protease with MMP-like domain